MAGGAALKNITTFDEAWPILQEEAINKLIANLEIEGLPYNKYFTSQEYIRFYTIIYTVYRPREAQKLYNQYQRTFEDYISSKVLPSLRGKENESLLKELLRRWNNHKTMTRLLSRFFHYLSRYHIPRMQLPSLVETSHLTFNKMIFGELKDQVSDAIISLVNREREGEQIDLAMVKQVLEIFEEISENALKRYIEESAVNAMSNFRSKKGLDWIAIRSCKEYQRKVKECSEKRKARILEYSMITESESDKVFEEIEDQLNDAMISLAMVKQVLDIFEVGADALRNYAHCIEEALVEATARFYSNKAFDWIDTNSYDDYKLKSEKCLEKEKSRVSDYLRLTNKNRVLEVVQHELINVHASKLEQKKASSRIRC